MAHSKFESASLSDYDKKALKLAIMEHEDFIVNSHGVIYRDLYYHQKEKEFVVKILYKNRNIYYDNRTSHVIPYCNIYFVEDLEAKIIKENSIQITEFEFAGDNDMYVFAQLDNGETVYISIKYDSEKCKFIIDGEYDPIYIMRYILMNDRTTYYFERKLRSKILNKMIYIQNGVTLYVKHKQDITRNYKGDVKDTASEINYETKSKLFQSLNLAKNGNNTISEIEYQNQNKLDEGSNRDSPINSPINSPITSPQTSSLNVSECSDLGIDYEENFDDISDVVDLFKYDSKTQDQEQQPEKQEQKDQEQKEQKQEQKDQEQQPEKQEQKDQEQKEQKQEQKDHENATLKNGDQEQQPEKQEQRDHENATLKNGDHENATLKNGDQPQYQVIDLTRRRVPRLVNKKTYSEISGYNNINDYINSHYLKQNQKPPKIPKKKLEIEDIFDKSLIPIIEEREDNITHEICVPVGMLNVSDNKLNILKSIKQNIMINYDLIKNVYFKKYIEVPINNLSIIIDYTLILLSDAKLINLKLEQRDFNQPEQPEPVYTDNYINININRLYDSQYILHEYVYNSLTLISKLKEPLSNIDNKEIKELLNILSIYKFILLTLQGFNDELKNPLLL
jgi:hypothetical protein